MTSILLCVGQDNLLRASFICELPWFEIEKRAEQMAKIAEPTADGDFFDAGDRPVVITFADKTFEEIEKECPHLFGWAN